MVLASISFYQDEIAYEDNFRGETFDNTPYHLVIQGDDTVKEDVTELVFPRNFQIDPRTREPLSVGFVRYREDEDNLLRLQIPFLCINEELCPAVKRGNLINYAFQKVHCGVFAPANRIPPYIPIDMTGVESDDKIKLKDIINIITEQKIKN